MRKLAGQTAWEISAQALNSIAAPTTYPHTVASCVQNTACSCSERSVSILLHSMVKD